MSQSMIAALLRDKIGLDANSIGASAITSAITQRMTNCGITQISQYLEYLENSPPEWDALIDSVIVPETWFFREPKSFTFLQNYVLSQWLPHYPQGVLRVLSVPCATGEEPYSIAIALLEAGLTPAQIHIDAVDVSKQCLIKAQRAIYDHYSFRGHYLPWQQQYFQATKSGYSLHVQVKKLVNLIKGNLIHPDLLVNNQPYDVIFCRNLLIYFDHNTKEKTIHLLNKLLVPGGLLFVAYVEAALIIKTPFFSVCESSTVAYKKQTETISHHQPILDPQLITQHCYELPIKDTAKVPSPTPITTDNPNTNLLALAKKAADQGCLDEATKICHDCLDQNPMNADVYVLLGEIQQATGQNEQAVQSFRKAIYLKPDQEAALIHLALLQEQQGNMASANLIWQRIYRLQSDQK